MKLRYVTVLTVGLLTTQVAVAEESSVDSTTAKTETTNPSQSITSQKDKLSYSFGLNIGKNLKQQEVDVSLDMLVRGIKDVLFDIDPLMTQEEVTEVLMSHQKERLAKQAEERKQVADKNLQEGTEFLQKNKGKEGIITLPSGLQYRVIKQGEGKSPKADDTVTTHYRGTLINGTEFDSSYSRGTPATFPVKGVIPGWTEALQLMKEGAKWQLFIPADLAYGEGGRGRIEPNSTLLFDLELISVNGKVTEEK
jgi:FKBP-type peptidyl-prolyl cis-trans isomerase